MTDTQVAAPSAPGPTLTIAQAAQLYAERKAEGEPKNSVSEAARIMGQQGAKARADARQAQVPEAQAQQTEEAEDTATAPDAETTTEQPASDAEQPVAEVEAQNEPIDLGEGVSLTRDEIRKSILRQADYTKKTQEVADQRKALEARESQKLTQLDNIINALQEKAGKPKSLSELIREFGPIDAVEKYAEQEENQKRLEAAQGAAQRQRNDRMSRDLGARDKALAESYNADWLDASKRDAAYTELTAFALKMGAQPDELRYLPSPWMIQILDMANKQAKTEAGASKITKAIAGKPAVVKPGAKVSAQGSAFNRLQSAEANLKSSGKLADAVALLQARRGQRG